MPAATGVHPTMGVRLWFGNAGRPHQRACTLAGPDPAAGTLSLEFALHEGCAGDWARARKPGDTIEATVRGTGFERPRPEPTHVFALGDPASLPALDSLLGVLDSVPATVWSESAPDDTALPLRTDPAHHEARRVPRQAAGDRLAAEVRSARPPCSGPPRSRTPGSPATRRRPGPGRRTSARNWDRRSSGCTRWGTGGRDLGSDPPPQTA